ncbi:hypothetical protein K435DRAFT_223207 [Dendrothele bispora CBS 962.96]|uniref:Uncharacterized protein n=1 Tax=Dendrothele bispora (strain CBS 962.96) TaxID=1314807 RepID=A0A4S8LQY9_DENBC|nr:hypothetical protein K435DRAFT_223207 [Dendrothele bispora CBS 962.96]
MSLSPSWSHPSRSPTPGPEHPSSTHPTSSPTSASLSPTPSTSHLSPLLRDLDPVLQHQLSKSELDPRQRIYLSHLPRKLRLQSVSSMVNQGKSRCWVLWRFHQHKVVITVVVVVIVVHRV